MSDASATVALDDADGILTVVVPCPDGSINAEVDVYKVHNLIYDAGRRLADQPVAEYHEAVLKIANDAGVPIRTHYAADRFARAVAARVEELRGKTDAAGANTAASPGSTN